MWKQLSARQSGNFSYNFWKFAVTPDRVFISVTTTAVSKQIALPLRQMPEAGS